MFDKIKVLISRHAMSRFIERIDPTAKMEQVKNYVRESLPSRYIQELYPAVDVMRLLDGFDYGLNFYYQNVVFVLRKTACKGRSVTLITCYWCDNETGTNQPNRSCTETIC